VLDREGVLQLNNRLTRVFNGLTVCGRKLTSAAKFIDFFVHDILDYTILNKEEKNFAKEFTVFDLRDAVS